jgi:GrpB-like predicted nucleotidyltransferase (UPF0157 family)
VHLCSAGSEQERRHIAFRDALRSSPRLAARYVALKRQLAKEHHGLTLESREQYSLGKGAFVEAVLRGSGQTGAA